MSRGSNIGWDDTRVSFNDANAAMGNATANISQAGTVFGQLRKSILEEEQRAVDNQYRAKLFDENVRQFGMQHALSQDKLSEDILSHRNTEGLTARGQDVQTRGHDLSYKASMASVGAQNFRNALLQKQYDDTKKKEAIYTKAAQNEVENRNVLDAKISANENLVGPSTPEMDAQLDRDKELRKALTSRQIAENIAIKSAQEGYVEPLTSLLATDIAQTDARAIESTEQKIKQQKALEESQLKASKTVDDLNLVESDKKNANSVITQLVSKLGVSPEVAASIVTSYYPTTGAWTSFGTGNQQKFDTPLTEIGDALSNFNINNPKDPILLKAIPFVKNKKNTPTEKTGTSTPSLSPSELGGEVDLSTLSPSALDYKEKNASTLLPKPDDVKPTDADVQANLKRLYWKEQGDIPKKDVPEKELKALQEKAEKQAAINRQKEIDNVAKQYARERQRRTQSKHTDLTGLTTVNYATYMW